MNGIEDVKTYLIIFSLESPPQSSVKMLNSCKFSYCFLWFNYNA